MASAMRNMMLLCHAFKLSDIDHVYNLDGGCQIDQVEYY